MRLPAATVGKPVKSAPTGFPNFVCGRHPRIVTADVWTYLRYACESQLPKAQQPQGLAFVHQAFEFFQAASNPHIGSRPLLYYYSFLNLAKVLLLVEGRPFPRALRHGISDPRVNSKTRLRLSGQSVLIAPPAHDHSQLCAELITALGGNAPPSKAIRIMTLLRQIPGIHRTFCRITSETPSFVPITRFDILRNNAGAIFARMVLDRSDEDVAKNVQTVLRQRSLNAVFTRVQAQKENELWFESSAVPGVKRATDNAVNTVASNVCSCGVWSLLTYTGHRLYLSTVPPRDRVPPLAAIYAVMFYLGSITRYKPYDFDKIVAKQFAWVVAEFIKTQPTQFIYGLASRIARVDVCRPFAALD